MAKPKRKQPKTEIDGLVTHKEKQIAQANGFVCEKKGIDLFEEELISESIHQDEGEGRNHQLEQMVAAINKLISKNKINNRNAFEFPIIDIDIETIGSYFKDNAGLQYDDDENQMAWRRISSVLENDSKIYGWRVDNILDVAEKIGHSLLRKDQKFCSKISNGQTEKTKKRVQYDTSQLLESQIYQNIKKHLDLSSNALNSNLAKLMIKKDPTFEKTRRKFDQTGSDMMFLNTLQMSEQFELKILDKVNKNQSPIPQQQCDKSTINNYSQIEVEQMIPKIEESTSNQLRVTSLIEEQLKSKTIIKFTNNFDNLYLSLNSLYPIVGTQDQIGDKHEKNLWHIYNKIDKCQFGTDLNYWENENYVWNQFKMVEPYKPERSIEVDEEKSHYQGDQNNLFRMLFEGKKPDNEDQRRVEDEGSQAEIHNFQSPRSPQLLKEPEDMPQKILLRSSPNKQSPLKELEYHSPMQPSLLRIQQLKQSHSIDMEEAYSYPNQLSLPIQQMSINLNKSKLIRNRRENNIQIDAFYSYRNIMIQDDVAGQLFRKKGSKNKRVTKTNGYIQMKKPRMPRVPTSNPRTKKAKFTPKKRSIQQIKKSDNSRLFDPSITLDRTRTLRKEPHNQQAVTLNNKYLENNIIGDRNEKIENLIKSESSMAPLKKISLNVNETKRNDGSEKQDEPRIMNNIKSFQEFGSCMQEQSPVSNFHFFSNIRKISNQRLPPMLKIKQKLLNIIDHSKRLDFCSIYKKYLKIVTQQYQQKCIRGNRTCNQENNEYIITNKICFIALLHLANEKGFKLRKLNHGNFLVEFV